MEGIRWKKDLTSYIVFACKNCKEYIYVKITQKNKKCLRCGASHLVKNIENKGIVIEGINNAMKMVKMKQNELASKENGSPPNFRTNDDFNIVGKASNQLGIAKVSSIREDIDLNHSKLLKALLELNRDFQEFPFYLIEIVAKDLEIHEKELKHLLREYINAEILIPLKNQYFRMSKKPSSI